MKWALGKLSRYILSLLYCDFNLINKLLCCSAFVFVCDKNLVSLHPHHLNLLQVIALICYLMETKNDRGPFLVVVPSSVLPGWESEINFWAPRIHKIVYCGPPEERRRLFK